jgi:hypothetical protein
MAAPNELHAADIFRPVPHDACVARKLAQLYPSDDEGRRFVRVKAFDSSALCYYDGRWFYWWSCFCKPCQSYQKNNWMRDVPHKCAVANSQSTKVVPYSVERVAWKDFKKFNELYSAILVSGAFVPPELTVDLTPQQVAKHTKAFRKKALDAERRDRPRDKQVWQAERRAGRAHKYAQ